ncbi:hypothetical protein J6590_011531 [Homalodisca vitripennis]|nr:hypothetical protein J6590_011531 [Homalodisca vitripennis]
MTSTAIPHLQSPAHIQAAGSWRSAPLQDQRSSAEYKIKMSTAGLVIKSRLRGS